MLCPEVSNFPAPKVIRTLKSNETLENVLKSVNMNSFYSSVVITCPDELQTPITIKDLITEDTEYYKIFNCSLLELVEENFIENFVKKGHLHCLSDDRNCIIDNCVALTPDGILTLHLLDYVFQTLGFEGTKRAYNYYEVKLDLKNLKRVDKVRLGLQKLEQFNLLVIWEPNIDNVCPSSIAKYFHDKNYKTSLLSLELKTLSPSIDYVPSIKDTDADEIVEWIGILALEGDVTIKETYISTYSTPESDCPIESSRISLFIAKGMLTPSLISSICKKLAEYVTDRNIENYWSCISIQSCENSLWQWSGSTPKMFQAHDCSFNVFFTKETQIVYSVGQLKYS